MQHELVLRAAHRRIDRQILNRLQVEGDAANGAGLLFQPTDHVANQGLALITRLQVDQESAGVERRVGAVDADK